MDYSILKDWLIPVSTAVSTISVAVGVWLSLRVYRLKVKTELRLANSSKVESDIKLLKSFTKIMDTAHAREKSVVSEKLIEVMMRPELHLLHETSTKEDIKDAAIITIPVGTAAQDAAIAAICVLGKEHALLYPVALRALESLLPIKEDIVRPYFDELRKDNHH